MFKVSATIVDASVQYRPLRKLVIDFKKHPL